ncbi:phosphate ABC transporter permease PstA [Tomitella fengzijianii]|uniref:Phosphate transport system permease protein PstA n=1 Tax=Tomitella fengzijianii TaxID=2597660 RepID=A0A516X1G0_9ACTN|nr:phosphate ABC transporter permease PstA [Tomitella fengzijianii]QDQ96870.1 phosphate ABC transporter permease PstA [Tomitella fengzijianii]
MTLATDARVAPVRAATFVPTSRRRRCTDGAARILVWASVAVALVPLAWILWTVTAKGLPAVASSTWFTNSLSGLSATTPGGGVYHAIIGTLLQGLVCSVIAIPLGISVAVYLVEYAGASRLGKVTTFMVDVLAGVPSIVAALFIYALWVVTFGFDRSGIAVALALVLLMVPMVVRSTEEMLRIVPTDLREAAFALGVPQWKTIAKVVLPTALPGIVTGTMLAIARVLGETAPLLILVGYAPFINFDLGSGEMGTLPGLIVDQMNNPGAVGADRMWGSALTLIGMVAILSIAATLLARRSTVRGGR